ncbi:TolB family protein [Gemmatimonadota bacterium]
MTRVNGSTLTLLILGLLVIQPRSETLQNPRLTQSGPEIIQLTDTGDAYWPVWSPDGSRIAYYTIIGSDEWQPSDQPVVNLWVMDRDGSNTRRVWDGRGFEQFVRPFWTPSWSHDGRYIAVDRAYRESAIIDVETGNQTDSPIFTTVGIIARFSPGKPYLNYAQRIWEHDEYRTTRNDRIVFILDTLTGESRTIHTTGYQPESGYEEPASVWSADGQLLRVRDHWGTGRQPFFFIEVSSGERILRSEDSRGEGDLRPLFPDALISRSGTWRVVSPEIPDTAFLVGEYGGFRYLRSPLKVIRQSSASEDQPGSQEYILSQDEVLYYSWHPEEDYLLYSTAKRSSDSSESNRYAVYLAKF